MSTPEEMEVFYVTVFGIDDDDLVLALFDQGLDTIDNYNLLSVDDIVRVCNNIRKPGGMIVNDDGDLVPDRGQAISTILEKRLKQFWFFLRYSYMTQRIPDFTDVADFPQLSDLHDLDSFRNSFQEPKDVEKPPQFPGIQHARRWFEQFDTWATKYLGPSGVPLLYVLRMDPTIAAEDPGWFQPSLREDLSLRGPHPKAGVENMFWREDNTTVWDMLLQCIHPTKEYAYIKAYEKKCDGHSAYVALKRRMLGPGITKSLEAVADKIIRSVKYSGSSRGFTFDKMVTALQQGFIDCGTEYSETKKVQMLIDAITDPSLESAKQNIRSSDKLKNNFLEAVANIQEQLAERVDVNNRGTRMVSAFGKKSSGSSSSKKKRFDTSKFDKNRLNAWDPSKPGALYTNKVWHSLTAEQKKQHKAARFNKKSNGSTGRSNTNNGYKSQIAALNQKVSELESNLAAAQAVTEHQSIGAAISGKRKRDS
jgi:hypothetical protein